MTENITTIPVPVSIKTIAFLYPGMMGSSLARTINLNQPNINLLTCLSGRSSGTISRAEHSGLIDVSSFDEIVTRADLIFSILPPSESIILSKKIANSIQSLSLNKKGGAPKPIYLDANAISPRTMEEISNILKPHGIPLIDGAVIGGPANENYQPKLYLSSQSEYKQYIDIVRDTLSKAGLNVHVLENEGASASALKMCYGGITKGTTGLATMLVLAANAHSPSTAQALLAELSSSQSAKLESFTKTIPGMVPKAYRWIGEMEEIATFLSDTLVHSKSANNPVTVKSTNTSTSTVADTYRGMAQIYQRIADELEANDEKEDHGRGEEVRALLEWTDKGKQLLADV